MARFTIAHETFDLDRRAVEEAIEGSLPDPVNEHYVLVLGRRYPPKQVIACATGLDRADFTTHQARRVLKRLGFTAARRSGEPELVDAPGGEGPYGGRQAAALKPYAGKWVALASPQEVLVAADSPQEVLEWLSRHGLRATFGMFRVPATRQEAEGIAPQ